MQITGTHHVAIYTANFERLRDFYVTTLGLPVRVAVEGYNIVFVDAGTTTIEIEEETNGQPTEGSWRHLALEVADADAAYRELAAQGVLFHMTPADFPAVAPKARIAFFRDPDGNELELFQPLGSQYSVLDMTHTRPAAGP